MEKIVVFAKNLEHELLAMDIKQKDLALKLDCTPQTISDYIKYGRTNGNSGKKPSLENVLRIAEILNLSLDRLFELRSKEDNVKLSISTVGDALKELLWLEKELPCNLSPDESNEYATLQIYVLHDAINSFFMKRNKMRHLYVAENIIDEDLYSTWYRAEIEKMCSIDLKSSARPASLFDDLKEEEEGVLPF